MIVDSIDFFYAAIPDVSDDADGSQDALLVRVLAGGIVGWGECEASPLTSIAAFVTPRSHGVCEPVAASVLGQELSSPSSIARIHNLVRRRSMDLLQAAHVWSGVEVALWDVLGQARQEPIWAMLGFAEALPKVPYSSLLFGATPQDTFDAALDAVGQGFGAVKFGWGGFGSGEVSADIAQLEAARAGVGTAALMVDAGQIWAGRPEEAFRRVAALAAADVTWLEEPFAPDEYWLYSEFADRAPTIALAGGEAAHSREMAETLIRYGQIAFVQIDTGRIGGILPSKQIADFAASSGVSYVNHTFTSHLALSAAMHSFAGAAGSKLCEYPGSLSPLARAIPTTRITVDEGMRIEAPSAPGLGIGVDLDAIQPYLRTVEILVDGVALVEPTGDGGMRVVA